jgi:hypothetical protein
LTLISNAALFVIGGPSTVVGSPYGTVASITGIFALYSLATYEAAAIQRVLPVKLYKNQARGISLVAVGLIVLSSAQIAGAAFGTPVGFPFIDFTWIVLFYWIDASIQASRRSDPLLRDTFRWSLVRVAVWVLMVGSMAIILAFAAYQVVAEGVPLSATANLPFGGTQGTLGFLSYFLPIILGAIYLPIAALRSRDPTLRRHLERFGLFVLCFMIVILTFGLAFIIGAGWSSVAQSEILALGSFFLYRSARSLVPLNRISLDQNSD